MSLRELMFSQVVSFNDSQRRWNEVEGVTPIHDGIPRMLGGSEAMDIGEDDPIFPTMFLFINYWTSQICVPSFVRSCSTADLDASVEEHRMDCQAKYDATKAFGQLFRAKYCMLSSQKLLSFVVGSLNREH